MLNQFSRTQLILGAECMETLARSRVAVFGIGGVGGYCVEALARSGVGALDLIDHDDVCVSNLNRQIIATYEAVGHPKVEVAAQRIAQINPDCKVNPRQCFYLPDTADQFDFSQYDYVVDAVDTVTAKLLIITEAKRCGTPIISSMGAANKMDPAALEVDDIYRTSVCPLSRILRKELRKRGIDSLKVVYSKEPAITLDEETVRALEEGKGPDGPETISRHGIPGSVAFVPAAAGLIIASEVVKDLVGWQSR